MSARPSEQLPRLGSRELFGMTRHDSSLLQVVTSVVIVVVSALTIQPRGWSGAGVATMLLVVLNSLLLFSRHVPDAMVSDRGRRLILGAGVVASAAVVAMADHGTAYLFGFYVAGHAGYRLSSRPALAVAAATSVADGGVLLLHIGPGHHSTPWLVGAATGFSVLLGMINRSRREALAFAVAAAESAERATESAQRATESAQRAAESTERAARAEAREAVLAERGRIARDVHDVLAHSLAGINMQLEVADAMLDAGDLHRSREATHRAQSLVREGLVEVQRTVQALRDDALPLVPTLHAMVESSGHAGGLEVVGVVREVATPVSQAIVRVCQEALTNAARYAHGVAVCVRLGFEPGSVVLEVVNDPPDPQSPAATAVRQPGTGMGLIGMRERTALLAGTVSAGPVVDGVHAGGWRICATIPA